jgi:molybdate transport system substrate-binding protein
MWNNFFHPVIVIFIVLLTACNENNHATVNPAHAASASGDVTLTIFAAASLTESFTKIAAEFESRHPEVYILPNFAGSQSLRSQLEQGARADVFVSANTQHTEALLKAQLIQHPTIFTHNKLVVITPANNPAGLNSLQDLTKPNLKLVLAGPEVPVGRYTRQSLEKLSRPQMFGAMFQTYVQQNVVSEEDTVKGVVAKVQLGEADAGIVYASDVTPAVADAMRVIEIPNEYNIIANYPIAVITDSAKPKLAQQFVDFVLSPAGQKIMTEYGFQSEP